MKTLKLYSVLLLVVWLITSCEKEKNTGEMPVSLKGVFVINEGAFVSDISFSIFFSADLKAFAEA